MTTPITTTTEPELRFVSHSTGLPINSDAGGLVHVKDTYVHRRCNISVGVALGSGLLLPDDLDHVPCAFVPGVEWGRRLTEHLPPAPWAGCPPIGTGSKKMFQHGGRR